MALNVSTHLENIKNYASAIGKEKAKAIVGEWSAALTDCAPWLNGVGLGSRYEGTAPYTNDRVGSCAEFNKSPDKWSKNKRKTIEDLLKCNFTNTLLTHKDGYFGAGRQKEPLSGTLEHW